MPRTTQDTISSYLHKPLSNKKILEIDFSLVEAIVKNSLPFKKVEGPHFQKFAHKLYCACKMANRKTVSDVLLPQTYKMTKGKVKHSLDSADAVSFTTARLQSEMKVTRQLQHTIQTVRWS